MGVINMNRPQKAYRRDTEFTALQIARIYNTTIKIMNGIKVPDNTFDSVIALIDRKKPDLSFDELFRLAELIGCRQHNIHVGKGG